MFWQRSFHWLTTWVVATVLYGPAGESFGQGDFVAIESARDWPWWRGPNADGIAVSQKVPTSWSPSENVLWSARLAGIGHSSPIVVDGKVLLTTASDEGQVQSLQCLNLADGSIQWTTALHQGQFAKIHRDNSQSSATPATDGKRVYTVFGNRDGVQLSAVDLNGQIVWQKTVGPYPSEHGFCSSVCLFEDMVYVAGEAHHTGFLGAFDGATGEAVWRVPREPDSEHANYASPIVVQLAGRPQLIIGGWHLVSSYDPMTGEVIWENPGPADVNANCIAVQDPLLIVSGGYPQKEIICINTAVPVAKTSRQVVWSSKRYVCWVPSPLIHNGRVLVVTDNGVAYDLDIDTGEPIWTQRIGSKAYASPIKVGDLFVATTLDGKATVFRSNDGFQSVSENIIPNSGNATPVAVDGKLLIRAADKLYCIGRE